MVGISGQHASNYDKHSKARYPVYYHKYPEEAESKDSESISDSIIDVLFNNVENQKKDSNLVMLECAILICDKAQYIKSAATAVAETVLDRLLEDNEDDQSPKDYSYLNDDDDDVDDINAIDDENNILEVLDSPKEIAAAGSDRKSTLRDVSNKPQSLDSFSLSRIEAPSTTTKKKKKRKITKTSNQLEPEPRLELDEDEYADFIAPVIGKRHAYG